MDCNIIPGPLARYSRNIAVPQIGEEGQRRLLASSVLVVGCGALGSVVAMYLAGAGVGHLGLVDFDTVDVSNLQRQLFFTEQDAGNSKAECLKRAVEGLNSSVKVDTVKQLFSQKNASDLCREYDFIIDATDNPSSKKLIDATALVAGRPCCIGGVAGFAGQVTTCLPSSLRYTSIFPDAEAVPFTPCGAGGVIGPAAGVVASVQAAEAIKYLSGITDLLDGRLLVVDLLAGTFDVFEL